MTYTRFPPSSGVGAPDTPPAISSDPSGALPDTAPDAATADPGTPAQVRPQAIPHERLNPLVFIFVLSLFVPLFLSLGGLNLTPARIVLILLMIPVSVMFVTGRAGRILTADILMIGFAFWMAVSIFAYGGTAQIEFIGISTIEILCPYFLARCLIRTQAQFNALMRVFLLTAALVAALAAVEAITDINLISRLFDPLGRVHASVPDRYDRRLGMLRAQSGFQHPILFGVAMAMMVAPLFFSRRRKTGERAGIRAAVFPAAATFFSLSVGAWLSVIIQIGLISWNYVLRRVQRRWMILLGLVSAAYIAIDLLSNRSPIEVAISYLTFSSGNAYWRKLIFDFGIENVWDNPLFGIGLGDWVRPSWMYSSSVDNYWLLNAMRHGIPGFLLVFGAYLAVIWHLARARLSDPTYTDCRMGMIIMLVGIAFSITTVHIWGTVFYLWQFILGTGLWLVEAEEPAPRHHRPSNPAPVPDPVPSPAPEPVRGPASGPAFARARL